MRFVRCKTTSGHEAMILTPEQMYAVVSDLREPERTLTAFGGLYRSPHIQPGPEIGPDRSPVAAYHLRIPSGLVTVSSAIWKVDSAACRDAARWPQYDRNVTSKVLMIVCRNRALAPSRSWSRGKAVTAHDLGHLRAVGRTAGSRVDHLGTFAEVLRTDCSRCDYAKCLHLLPAVIGERVNSTTRNAECLPRTDLDWFPSTVQVSTPSIP